MFSGSKTSRPLRHAQAQIPTNLSVIKPARYRAKRRAVLRRRYSWTDMREPRRRWRLQGSRALLHHSQCPPCASVAAAHPLLRPAGTAATLRHRKKPKGKTSRKRPGKARAKARGHDRAHNRPGGSMGPSARCADPIEAAADGSPPLLLKQICRAMRGK